MSHLKDNRLLDVLVAVIDSLRSARASHMVIGAWAVAVWGRPRATMDLDFMLMLEEGALGRLGGAEGEQGSGGRTHQVSKRV